MSKRPFLSTGIVPLLSFAACGATSATTSPKASGGIDGPLNAPADGPRRDTWRDTGALMETDAIPSGSGGAAERSDGAADAGGADAGRTDGDRGGDTGGDTPAAGGASCPVAMVSGRYHSFARKRDGTLWFWGGNNHGQLGWGMPGVTTFTPVRSTALGAGVAEVSAGYARTCARKTDGTLWCWGENTDGQAGDGTKEDKQSPVQVAALGTSVAGVAAARDHTCARKGDGTVWCWGSNSSGRLGDGTTTDSLSPVPVTALGGGVVDVRATGGYTCARKGDGTLWCWGGNDVGQLGDGSKENRSAPAPVPALGANVAGVSVGIRHTCARKTDGTLWCWGGNDMGQLGDGTKVDTTSPVRVTAMGTDVVDVVAGMYFTCAAKADGTLWCWGESRNGQLGYGGRGTGECRSYTGSLFPCQPVPVKVTGLCP